jgi:hypothetical protein
MDTGSETKPSTERLRDGNGAAGAFQRWRTIGAVLIATVTACTASAPDASPEAVPDAPPRPGPSKADDDSRDGGDLEEEGGGPDGAKPGPASCNLPPRDCTGDEKTCGALIPFQPVTGPGYDNYPLNGETAQNQYRSFARRDLVMLVKYATAFVECHASGWPGNGKPLGLGDMSESDGKIPGTSIGQPGHPQGTHTNGFDMDIAYYQQIGTDNYLRPVCPHMTNGADQSHCVGAPDNLDVDRTALVLGAFFTSSRVRVIGVDGKVGPLVLAAMAKHCQKGLLPQDACTKATAGLAFETTDQGRGWYLFHLHHFHVSLKPVMQQASGAGLLPGGGDARGEMNGLLRAGVPGEAVVR